MAISDGRDRFGGTYFENADAVFSSRSINPSS